jgi:hypothetical protein
MTYGVEEYEYETDRRGAAAYKQSRQGVHVGVRDRDPITQDSEISGDFV